MEKLSASEAVRRLKENPATLFLDLEAVMTVTGLTSHELLDELASGRLKSVHEGSYDTAQAMWNGARVSVAELIRWMERFI